MLNCFDVVTQSESSGMSRAKRTEKDDDLPEENWLAAFRNPASTKHPGGSVFLRQFRAAGFYEAFDTVMSHAERSSLEVLWFKEKRLCEQFINKSIQQLDSRCTYCNKRFNHSEPIPCLADHCSAEFCSRECVSEHVSMRHPR